MVAHLQVGVEQCLVRQQGRVDEDDQQEGVAQDTGEGHGGVEAAVENLVDDLVNMRVTGVTLV